MTTASTYYKQKKKKKSPFDDWSYDKEKVKQRQEELHLDPEEERFLQLIQHQLADPQVIDYEEIAKNAAENEKKPAIEKIYLGLLRDSVSMDQARVIQTVYGCLKTIGTVATDIFHLVAGALGKIAELCMLMVTGSFDIQAELEKPFAKFCAQSFKHLIQILMTDDKDAQHQALMHLQRSIYRMGIRYIDAVNEKWQKAMSEGRESELMGELIGNGLLMFANPIPIPPIKGMGGAVISAVQKSETLIYAKHFTVLNTAEATRLLHKINQYTGSNSNKILEAVTKFKEAKQLKGMGKGGSKILQSATHEVETLQKAEALKATKVADSVALLEERQGLLGVLNRHSDRLRLEQNASARESGHLTGKLTITTKSGKIISKNVSKRKSELFGRSLVKQKYSAITPEARLPIFKGDAKNLRGATYWGIEAQPSEIFYRWGRPDGSWWSRTPPNSKIQSMIDLSVLQEWNAFDQIAVLKIPRQGLPGLIFEGIGGTQGGQASTIYQRGASSVYVGAKGQVYIPRSIHKSPAFLQDIKVYRLKDVVKNGQIILE